MDHIWSINERVNGISNVQYVHYIEIIIKIESFQGTHALVCIDPIEMRTSNGDQRPKYLIKCVFIDLNIC